MRFIVMNLEDVAWSCITSWLKHEKAEGALSDELELQNEPADRIIRVDGRTAEAAAVAQCVS